MAMQHGVSLLSYCLSLYCLSLYCLSLSLSLSMTSLVIGSLNVNGSRSRQKRAMIKDYFDLKRVDVLFLQETHTAPSDETDWALEWGGPCCFSHGTTSSAGVAVVFRAAAAVTVISTKEVLQGRLLLVQAQVQDVVFTFVNIYAPNVGADRVSFFQTLKDQLMTHLQDQLVVGGDFNCTLDFTMDRVGEEPHPQSARTLASVLSQLDMVDSFRVRHPRARRYTWVRAGTARPTAARLDRIYVPETLRSQLIRSSISPVGFSDHHLVVAELLVSPGTRTSTHWHFNNRLLQDRVFCRCFQAFWERWQGQKVVFPSLRLWWEVGKAQVRVFCQQYSSHSSSRLKDTIRGLEAQIQDLEERLRQGPDPNTAPLLREKRTALGSFLQERVKGALVRSRYQRLQDMDAPTSFFFNLERTSAQRTRTACLQLPEGGTTSDPVEMGRLCASFYRTLFTAEDCDQGSRAELLEGLPQLSPGERAALDSELTLEELTAAVGQMSSGRSPGLDGLPTDFFKHFWSSLGQDLHSVLLEGLSSGELPLSCRRAVLALLPKTGDLTL